MQQRFDSPFAARTAVMTFAAMGGLVPLPEDVRAKFLDLANQPSPVDQIVGLAELLYARQSEVTAEARDLAGSLASYASENYWHGMDADGRGNRMSLAMRRENSEEPPAGVTFPEPEDDPAPDPRYVSTPAAEPMPAPPPPEA